MLRKLTALALILCLCLTAFADSEFDDFVQVYNVYAAENNAPEMKASMAVQNGDEWFVSFDEGFTLALAFSAEGYADLMSLEAPAGSESAKRVFLNAWFVADAGLKYEDIDALVSTMLGSGKEAATLYMDWYIIYKSASAAESGTGIPMEYLGIVWVGTAVEPGNTPEPEATPAPSSGSTEDTVTKDGKVLHKA